MANDEDYYKILGIDKNATQDEITKAYREQAKKWHPDVNHSPEATQMFEKITKAYDILKDPDKRAAYDRFGNSAFDENGNAGFNPNNFSGFSSSGDFGDDLGDIFSQFFGGGRRRQPRRNQGPMNGENAYMRMQISFMDAINGRVVKMPYKYDQKCSSCNGKGAINPSDVVTCSACNGTGSVLTQQRTMFGVVQTQQVCTSCNGKGTVIVNPCSSCGGKGYVSSNVTLTINVPAGINEGQQLRVVGKGKRGFNGGDNGDLYIEIIIESDKTFTRSGNNINVDIKVPLITAVIGGTVTIPTVYGNIEYDIKSGTQPNTVLNLKGKGVKGLDGRTGDEFAKVIIEIPTRLTNEEKELYAQLGKISNEKGESKSFFQKFFKKK